MPSTIFSLLDTPAYGGAEEYLLQVLFHLKTRGCRVALATNNASVKKKAAGQIEIIHLPYRLDAIGNWKGLVKYFIALPGALVWLILTIRRLQKHDEVICLFPGYTDRLSFSPFVKKMGCRLIWLEYGPLEPTFSRNFGFPKLLYRIGKSCPDTVVTISEWTKQSLVQLGKIPKEKIEVIYPGIKAKHKREKGKGTNFVVTTIARLATEKEIDLLLLAWGKIDRTHKKLHIIGDGPEKGSLQKLAVELGIDESVVFTGFLSDEEKNELLSGSDLFVFPSSWDLEGFGMTTAEAMAHGVPVVTSGAGPQAEIVEDGKTGWIFKPHTAESLAKVMRHALSSPKRAAIGKAGQEKAQKYFSLPRMKEQWSAVIGV